MWVDLGVSGCKRVQPNSHGVSTAIDTCPTRLEKHPESQPLIPSTATLIIDTGLADG